MPTLTCIFYLLCLGVVYLFRTFYQGWAIPYLLLAMAAAPVLICLLSLPAMLKTELRMEGKSYVMKGERGEARFFFCSKRLLPVGRISLTIVFENHYTRERFQTQELFYSVSGGEARTILYPTDSCGKISFRITRFECRDLLGFFAVRRKCREMFSATVLPASVGPEKHLDIDAACNREVRLKPKYGGGFSERVLRIHVNDFSYYISAFDINVIKPSNKSCRGIVISTDFVLSLKNPSILSAPNSLTFCVVIIRMLLICDYMSIFGYFFGKL